MMRSLHQRLFVPLCNSYFGLSLFIAHALPLFKEEKPRSLKRKREKDRADPLLSRKPEAPIGKRGESIHTVIRHQKPVETRNPTPLHKLPFNVNHVLGFIWFSVVLLCML